MKTISLLKYLLVIALCASFQSCSKEDGPTVTPQPEEEKASIGCETTELTFDSEGGSHTFSFSANKDWTVKVLGNASWCTLSQSDGNAGTANITVTTSENTSYNDREVTLSIKCQETSHNITVTQKQNNAVILGTSEYKVGEEGGSITIGVKANVAYEVEIAGDAKNWIRKTGSKALTAYSHNFTILANESAAERKGEIHFISGEKTDVVEVIQSGAAKTLALTQKDYTVKAEGETVSVEIKTNIDYTIEMPQIDWVTLKQGSRALTVQTVEFIVKPNDGFDKRTTEILFCDKNSTLKETLTIVQQPKDILSVETKTYEVSQEGGEICIEFMTNITVDVTVNADWLKNKGLESVSNSHKKILRIQANQNDGSAREGQIVIANKEKGISETIVIKQEAKPEPSGKPNPGGNVEDMGWG